MERRAENQMLPRIAVIVTGGTIAASSRMGTSATRRRLLNSSGQRLEIWHSGSELALKLLLLKIADFSPQEPLQADR